ncbi:MAG: glutamate racemase [Spirochaetes bacterium]|nr:glutamate racemase [Spirochaetota bacterium]
MTKTIAFFDSGIGGLPYLIHLKNIKPDFNYVYLADTANFPYGIKSGEMIKEIVLSAISRFIEITAPDVVVIACNTASVITLPYLREKFAVPFIGVVPAVKPAASMSENKRIGLFATNKTVSDNYTDNLISQFAGNCEVYKYADSNIVSFIETKMFESDKKQILDFLRPAAEFFIEKDVDHVVLGCTHFLFIDDILEDLFPPQIKTISSREGVSRQILHILGESNAAAGGSIKNNQVEADNAKNCFYVTSETNREYYKKVAAAFRLQFAGVI